MEPIELNSGERIFSAVSSSLSSRSEAIIKKMLTGKFNKNGSVLEPFYIESSDTFFFFLSSIIDSILYWLFARPNLNDGWKLSPVVFYR